VRPAFGAAGRLSDLWPVPLAALVAALWPITAYTVNPYLFPLAAGTVGVAALVLWRPEYGIAAVLALAPWTNTVVGGSGLPDKPLHIVVPALAIGVLLYGMLVSKSAAIPSRARWLTASVLLFVGVGIASSEQAISPSQSITKVFAVITAAALFFAVLQICRERRQLLVVAVGCLAGLLLAGGQGVIEHYSGNFGAYSAAGSEVIVGRVEGSFGHPNAYGGFLAVLIPLAVAVMVSRSFSRNVRRFAGLALFLAVPAIVFSYSRGAIAAVVLGSLVWLALVRPRLAVVAVVCVGLAGVVLAPSTLKDRFSNQSTGDEVTLRSDIWGSAVDIYSEHPILGVGLNNFSKAYASLPSTLEIGSQRRLLHQSQLLIPPHAQNLYLNILAEEGILGLIAFLILSIASIGVVYQGCRVRDATGRAISMAAGAGIMTLAFHSLLDVTLFGPVAIPVFGLIGVSTMFVMLDRGGWRGSRRRLRAR
jgi:O-antigen ligase